ncbi:MAG: hypothetical protein JO045_00285 [Mycobacterium sp.]|nr:hypothetical protein [Mycobacterium sp.]
MALLCCMPAFGQIVTSRHSPIINTTPGDDQPGLRQGYEAGDVGTGAQYHGAAPAIRALQSDPNAPAWVLLGPTTGNVSADYAYLGRASITSGRITALAISPDCTAESCPLFVASAGGGVWRTMDGLSPTPQWTPVGDGVTTGSTGSLIFDPTDRSHQTLYLGTGETNGSTDSEAGRGLFKSSDLGNTWTLVAGSAAVSTGRAIGAVAVDPANANHILIGTGVARHGMAAVHGGRYTPPGAPQVGLYESKDGGLTFTLVFSQPSDTVDPTAATGNDYFRGGVTNIQAYRGGEDSHGPTQFYFAMMDYGLYRTTAVGGFEQVFASAGGGTPPSVGGSLNSRTEFGLAPMEDGLRIYVADSDTGGVANVFRTDNANVPAVQLTGPSGNTGWTQLSNSTSGTPGFGSYRLCGTQCSYDMFIVSPRGHPDTVWIGGSMQYDDLLAFNGRANFSNGRGVMRSTNAGVSFTDMTADVQPPLLTPNQMHPDQHAIVFAPGQSGIAFVGSDGGLVRTDGNFVNESQYCGANPNPSVPNPLYRGLTGAALANCQVWLSSVPNAIISLNAGLATLQYQGIALDPLNPRGSLLGGTQDNGTWAWDGTNWLETVGGDGGTSAINTAENRMHTYTGTLGDISFRGNDPLAWNVFDVPSFQAPSGEARAFYSALIADLRATGTWFIGLQHVWRTTDDLGGQAYMELYCNEFTATLAQPCGDWEPLGGADGTAPGNLTGSAYGPDKGTGWVAAIAQGNPNVHNAADQSPLWAGTRRGRVFISMNANASNASSVVFTRIDTANQPERFVSGIAVDPVHPTRAFVSFSGYNAYTPTTPGHVFEVEYHKDSGTATWTDISANLGDQPILGVAFDPYTGNVYVATDYGVAVRAGGDDGSKNWITAGNGLPTVAVYQVVIDPASRSLYATTHGRGIYRLDL